MRINNLYNRIIKSITEQDNKNSVASIAVMQDGNILMGKRKDSGKYTLPGGHFKQGENPLEAALRELEEESGIKADADKMLFLGKRPIINEKKQNLSIYSFLYSDKEKTSTKNDPDEEVEKWEWIPTKYGLPRRILDNLHAPKNTTLQILNLQDDDYKEEDGLERAYNNTLNKSEEEEDLFGNKGKPFVKVVGPLPRFEPKIADPEQLNIFNTGKGQRYSIRSQAYEPANWKDKNFEAYQSTKPIKKEFMAANPKATHDDYVKHHQNWEKGHIVLKVGDAAKSLTHELQSGNPQHPKLGISKNSINDRRFSISRDLELIDKYKEHPILTIGQKEHINDILQGFKKVYEEKLKHNKIYGD